MDFDNHSQRKIQLNIRVADFVASNAYFYELFSIINCRPHGDSKFSSKQHLCPHGDIYSVSYS